MWRYLEVGIGGRRCHRSCGWSPKAGISALIRRARRALASFLLSATWGCNKKTAICKSEDCSPQEPDRSTPCSWISQTPELLRNKFLLFKHLSMVICYKSQNPPRQLFPHILWITMSITCRETPLQWLVYVFGMLWIPRCEENCIFQSPFFLL